MLNGHHDKKEPKEVVLPREKASNDDDTCEVFPQVELDSIEQIKQEILGSPERRNAAFDELIKSYQSNVGFIQLLLAKNAKLDVQLVILRRPALQRRRGADITSSSSGSSFQKDVRSVLDAQQESIQRMEIVNSRIAQILRENPYLKTEDSRHT